MSLIAHLADDAVLLLRRLQELAFAEGVGQWLLDVDMLAEAHRVHAGGEVRVVGRRHENGVDLVRHLVEHLPEILEPRQIRKPLQALERVRRTDVCVAQRDKLADICVLRQLADVIPRLTADADRRKPNLPVGDIAPARKAPRQKRHRSRRRQPLQKSPSVHSYPRYQLPSANYQLLQFLHFQIAIRDRRIAMVLDQQTSRVGFAPELARVLPGEVLRLCDTVAKRL